MISPQLALEATVTSLEAFILDNNLAFEQKLDGNRVMLMFVDGAAPVPLTRGGRLYSKSIPKLVSDLRMPEGTWVIDGELVNKAYWAFDLPLSPATDATMSLRQRRAALLTLIKTLRLPGLDLVPQAVTRDEKIALAKRALERNFEGLLVKRLDSRYHSGGRNDSWLKVKFTATVDVIVTDVRADGKDSVGYAVLDSKGKLRDLGRASLIGKEKQAQILPGDVLEVRYLYVGANGRLYQPTIMRKRTDKFANECTDAQLRHVNKEVLEAL